MVSRGLNSFAANGFRGGPLNRRILAAVFQKLMLPELTTRPRAALRATKSGFSMVGAKKRSCEGSGC